MSNRIITLSLSWLLLSNLAIGQTGDFNADGIYDCEDIDALHAVVLAESHDADFDLTGDGLVDHSDRDTWLSTAGAINLTSGNPYLYGDANLDGAVDVSDFNSWNDHKFTFDSRFCRGDFNADGSVDGSDFMIWNTNKFTTSILVPPAGSLDGLVTYSYDESTGVLSMNTNGADVNCFTINGPDPLEMLQLDNGYLSDTGAYWMYSSFAGNLKWNSVDNSNVTGFFELARLEPGLSSDDFGVISFMNEARETGTTSIVITNAVPEPASLFGAVAALLSIGCRNRRPIADCCSPAKASEPE